MDDRIKSLSIAYFFPAFIGLLSAIFFLLAYKSFNVEVQLEPETLHIFRLALLLVSGAISGYFVIKAVRYHIVFKGLVFTVVFFWSSFHASSIHSELLSYWGVNCCRLNPASIASVIESILNPIFPFLSWFYNDGIS